MVEKCITKCKKMVHSWKEKMKEKIAEMERNKCAVELVFTTGEHVQIPPENIETVLQEAVFDTVLIARPSCYDRFKFDKATRYDRVFMVFLPDADISMPGSAGGTLFSRLKSGSSILQLKVIYNAVEPDYYDIVSVPWCEEWDGTESKNAYQHTSINNGYCIVEIGWEVSDGSWGTV